MPPNTEVEVRRSSRRRRTVSAYRDGEKTVVLVPASFSRAEEQRWVDRMLQRLAAREERRRPSDDALQARATELAERYLGDMVRPASVRWVDNQNARWGSCTPADRSIRLSRRLSGMPGWVVDYVLIHELVHLVVPGHGRDFWQLVQRYPKAERARGYLEGVSAAPRLAPGGGIDLSDAY
ncbi:M48 family metallopeptidase [Marinactinospora rubrisoli]|uniref:M48 family metallopeptidase n=1 Tax=Marinactinospora rubrisoli TaxID=2715399 RepID=A0ABW2KDT3_9ACTN